MAGFDGQFLDDPFVEVEYGDAGKRKTLRVTVLRVRQIPRFTLAYSAMLANLRAHQRVTLIDLIELRRDELLRVVAIATECTEKFIGENFNVMEFATLAQTVLDINANFFSPSKPALMKVSKAVDITWRWEDSIQHLVAAGHNETVVLGYSLAKFTAYSEAVERQQKRNRAMNLIDLRASYHYAEKDFTAHFKGLAHG